MAEAERIVRIFMTARNRAKKVRSFLDAQEYAEMLGDSIAKALNGIDFENLTEEEIIAMLNPVMRQAYDDAARVSATVVKAQTQKAGLGINALPSEYNQDAVSDLAKQFVGKAITQDFARNAITKHVLAGVDDTIRRNAESQDNMGLNVHIKRTYSDVGLRRGTPYAEPCQWCLERCGEWTSYQAAYNAGCFERHDGCLCHIDYDVGRTHTSSRSKGNWYNR